MSTQNPLALFSVSYLFNVYFTGEFSALAHSMLDSITEHMASGSGTHARIEFEQQQSLAAVQELETSLAADRVTVQASRNGILVAGVPPATNTMLTAGVMLTLLKIIIDIAVAVARGGQ
jgi:hypothetical protein